MDYEDFIAVVEQEIGERNGGSDEAIQATRATLQTLGERIDREEARQLAAQLPPELAPWIATVTPAQRFGADEFVRRVGDLEGVEPASAQAHVRAVLDALARALPNDEWSDVVAELPRTFAPLLPRGPHVEVPSADEFIAAVAKLAGISFEAADRAINAVLETLAERIAGGEVDDLILRLPMELHAPLERGRAHVRGQASPMRVDRFIETVAHREEVGLIEAARDIRAVVRVLRDAVGEQEFRDVISQLPDDYLRIFGL